MPVTRENVIAIKEQTCCKVALEPVFNIFNSLELLIRKEYMSGLNEWVYRTDSRLDERLKWNHRLAFEGLNLALIPEQSLPSFPDYIQWIGAVDPLHLRDKLFEGYLRVHPAKTEDGSCSHWISEEPDQMDPEEVLGSPEEYIRFLNGRFGENVADTALETEAYKLVIDPPAMQKFIVAHLWNIWDEVMAEEWERVKPMLSGVVNAFEKTDLQEKTVLEAAELVLDVDFESNHEKLKRKLENVQSLTFIPSAHIGPYQFDYGFGATKRLVFGMRLPRGTGVEAPELQRNEVLVRINALSDETRLKILQLIAATGPMSASDIMTHLGLSQSAASRHLMQLSATGYLTESRVQGAKQYTINPKRVEETLQAVSAFLLNK